jgi:uncharacterized protein YndB with AHSA1/START domain
MTTATELKIDVPADEPVIRTERYLAAPPELVFEMFTQPEHLRRWWGPRGFEIEVCEVDLQVGGGWRCTQRDPAGNEHGFHGTIRELDPPKMIARTFVYEGAPQQEAVETQVFEPMGDGTLVLGSLLCESFEDRSFHLEAGMDMGMRQTFLRLEELLESLTA